jgi:hypothetical protein
LISGIMMVESLGAYDAEEMPVPAQVPLFLVKEFF